MYKKLILIVLIQISVFMQYSCQREDILTEQVVVEGWIESGYGPIVILTKSIVVAEEQYANGDSDDLSVVLPWGKITVSDGLDTVVLTGRIDGNYYPPYVYSSDYLIGKPGRTYKLQIEYGNRFLTAETTIPNIDTLETVRVERCEDNDTLYQINAYFNDDLYQKDYYLFLTKLYSKEKRFYPAFLGLFNDDVLVSQNCCQVHPGIHTLTDTLYHYSSYYEKNDSVLFKFAKIDKTTYEIHESYNELVSLSSNPILVSNLKLKSNIKGGDGFWCGYATTNYRVVIADSIVNIK